MKKVPILFTMMILASSVFAQIVKEPNIVRSELSQAEIDRIVKTFTENEDKFRMAHTEYVFDRSVTVQTIGMGGQVSGQFRQDSRMIFMPDGRRVERISYAPISTLTEIRMTAEDIEDLGGVNPFALDPRIAPQYKFVYLGKEKIDDLNLYVFDVGPKVMPRSISKQRYFQGRIWVDDRDLMIVKSKGKGVPEDKNNKYPIVETWRENIDGVYWFPSYTFSNDELVFGSGQVVKLRMKVTYQNYRKGQGEVRIIGEEVEVDEEVIDEEDQKPKDPTKPPPPPQRPNPTPTPRNN